MSITFYDVAAGHVFDALELLAARPPKGRLNLTDVRTELQERTRGAIELFLKQLTTINFRDTELGTVRNLCKTLRALALTATAELGGEWGDKLEDGARRLQMNAQAFALPAS